MSLPSTVPAGFQATRLVDPDAVAFRTPGDEVAVTWREYGERTRAVAAGLHALGVRRGDTVAIMMRNRPESALADAGALHLGAAVVAPYNTLAPEQLAYVLSHSGAEVVICEEIMLERILASGVPLKQIICVDGPVEGANMSFDELEHTGEDDFDFDAQWQAVEADDVCCLIYTSGTTGNPKGVQITHRNIVAQVGGLEHVMPVRFGDRQVSFLPAAHIADRVASLYWMQLLGSQTTFVAEAKDILAALLDTRPTVWFAVPRIWEKFRAALEAKVAAEPDEAKRGFLQQALELGRAKAAAAAAGEELPAEQQAAWAKAEELVFSQLRAGLGLDQLRYGLSGAAPIAAETLDFFVAIGVNVCEVWGMTETTGIGTINPPAAARTGTVGVVFPGNEVSLAEDGELLFRGGCLMGGYKDAPDLTAAAIDADGWFRTGDIATISDDGYITIVDRKKELIISAAGKNMSPANIENTIKARCPMLASVVVIGDARAYNTALVTLDPDAAAAYAAKAGLSDLSPEALTKDEGLLAIVEAGIADGNAQLARVEQVKKYVVLPTFWEPGGDELTPTLKLRRKPIEQKYSGEIEGLYA